MARIRRVDCSGPGIRRRRRGRSFSYEDPGGQVIDDPEVLARIRGLGIPPAWKDVWICPIPTGHLQAVGTDAAGRRQYLYHEAWRTRREAAKFDHMLEFAHALPELRERAAEHLAHPDGASSAWAPRATPSRTRPTAWPPSRSATCACTAT
jgi:DNA topoisomerase-1